MGELSSWFPLNTNEKVVPPQPTDTPHMFTPSCLTTNLGTGQAHSMESKEKTTGPFANAGPVRLSTFSSACYQVARKEKQNNISWVLRCVLSIFSLPQTGMEARKAVMLPPDEEKTLVDFDRGCDQFLSVGIQTTFGEMDPPPKKNGFRGC